MVVVVVILAVAVVVLLLLLAHAEVENVRLREAIIEHARVMSRMTADSEEHSRQARRLRVLLPLVTPKERREGPG